MAEVIKVRLSSVILVIKSNYLSNVLAYEIRTNWLSILELNINKIMLNRALNIECKIRLVPI